MLRRLLPVVAIMLFAAVTRIANVSTLPVNTDEGWSIWASDDSTHQVSIILDRVGNDRHPPLYFLALSAWSTVAGASRLSLRFLSVASGLLTVAAAYRIGADWFGHRAGLYGALLLSVLKIAVYYSQDIRHYSWLLFWVCLTTLVFLRYLGRPRVRLLVVYAVFTALTLYTLYIGALILVVHGIVGLFLWRGSLRQKLALIGAYAGAFILYIPWLSTLLHQVGYLGNGIPSNPTSFGGLVATGGLLFGQEELALGIGLYALGLWSMINRRRPSIQQVTLVLCSAGLLLALVVINVRIGTLEARTLSFLAPMLIILCGYGLSLIESHPLRNILAVTFIVFALNPQSFVEPRMDSDVLARAVAADYTPGDVIILENGWDDFAFRYELMQAIDRSVDSSILSVVSWNDYASRQGYIDWPGLDSVLGRVKSPLEKSERIWIINYWVPSRLIPYLDTGNLGLQRTVTHDIPAGTQYQSLFPDHPTIQAILYERPIVPHQNASAAPGIDFGDTFLLRGLLIPSDVKAGQSLHVDLWWSALKQPPLDYSAGVYLMDAAGTIRAQHDGPPGGGLTSHWTVGNEVFDRHTLTVPADLSPGIYIVKVQLYWYGDRTPLSASGEAFAQIGSVQVHQGNASP